MQGYIITYESDKTTTINHKLFGKITSVKSGDGIKNYYYPGVLNDIQFFRLSKGCIFSEKHPGNLEGLLRIRDCDLYVDEDELYTALQYWKGKFREIEVKNF